MGEALLFECTLPLPPSVNNLFVNAARGRGRFPSAKYKAWKRDALHAIAKALPTLPPLIDKPVSVSFSIGKACRNDLDNCAKALIDFMVAQGVLINDDKSIVKRIVLEWGDHAGAHIQVRRHA